MLVYIVPDTNKKEEFIHEKKHINHCCYCIVPD